MLVHRLLALSKHQVCLVRQAEHIQVPPDVHDLLSECCEHIGVYPRIIVVMDNISSYLCFFRHILAQVTEIFYSSEKFLHGSLGLGFGVAGFNTQSGPDSSEVAGSFVC